MKTTVLSPLAVVLLTTGVLAQEAGLSRLPAVEARFEQVDTRFTLLEEENAKLRERLEILEDATCGCDICDCACICPGITFSIDWLYWQLHQDGLDYATWHNTGVPAVSYDQHSVNVGRDSGVRSRICYLMVNGWELAFAYTYFHTSGIGPRITRPPFPMADVEPSRIDRAIGLSGFIESSFRFD